MASLPERLSVLETDQKHLVSDVAEIKADVKTLIDLQTHNRGRASMRAEVLSMAAVAVSVAAAVGKFFIPGPHNNS
jgi:hypothetical protein